jgi:hypothetical protein
MSAPIMPINTDFQSLADAMKQISEQKAIEKDGKSIYQDEAKVYVTLNENKRYVTDIGVKAKKSKGIKADQLVETVNRVIQSAADNGAFKFNTSESEVQLGQMIRGLETLHDRIIARQHSISFIKKLIYDLFGGDKSEVVLGQIGKTIEIAKKHHLKLSAARLEQDILNLERKIEEGEKEWKKQSESKDKSTLESNHAKIEKKVKQFEQQLSEIKSEFERELKDYNNKAQSIEANIQKLDQDEIQKELELRSASGDEQKAIRQKENKKNIKGSKLGLKKKLQSKLGKKIELSQEQLDYQQIEKNLSEAKTKVGKAQEEIKELEKSLGQNKNKLNNLKMKYDEKHQELMTRQEKINSKLQKEKRELDLVNSQINQLQEIEQTIKKSQTDLEQKRKELEKTKSELQKILPEETDKVSASKGISKPKTKAPAVTSDLFALPANASPLQKQLMSEIQSQLDKLSDSNEAQKFKRQLIFGFSVGQSQTLEEIAKLDSLFTVDELRDLLEGGTGVTNLFYLAQFLEQRIPQVVVENDKVYLQSLQQMQSDIKRSIIFAFRARAIERSLSNINNPGFAKHSLKRLTTDIISELQRTEVKEGDRLFLPVGTTEHETLLCLQKGKDGKILTTLYNTGEGAEQQRAKGLNLKAAKDFFSHLQGEYPTSKSFPEIDSSKSEFQDMLFNVLNNRLVKGSVADLNSHLTQFLGIGQSGKAKPLQINGVCSFQVLNEAFENVMMPLDFLKFQRDLLTSIQEEFAELTKRLSVKTKEEQIIERLHKQLLVDNQKEIDKIKKRLEQSQILM